MSRNIEVFLNELVEGMRERVNARLDDVAFKEEIIGIRKTTAALYEAGVEDEKIISLLQEHWDLRPSEARGFLRYEKHR